MIYTTPFFVKFVSNLESTFVSVFECVVHVQGIHVKLCNQVVKFVQTVHCGQTACAERASSMTRLYMQVRIKHALKVSNTMNESCANGVKRNRKVLKLNHV